MQHYLQKGKAIQHKNDSKSIYLTYQQKSDKISNMSNDQKILYEKIAKCIRKNICVVCGSDNKLQRFSIVPVYYFQHITRKIGVQRIHDIVLLCHNAKYYDLKGKPITCHRIALKNQTEFQAELLTSNNIITHLPNDAFKGLKDARGCARLLKQFKNDIKFPENKRNKLLEIIGKYYGMSLDEIKNNISDEMIEKLISLKPTRNDKHKKQIQFKLREKQLEQLVKCFDNDYQKFVAAWRKSFVETSKPQFLPDYWAADNCLI